MGQVFALALDTTKIVLVTALAVSVAVGFVFYDQQAATINRLSDDLAEESLQVNQQQQTIFEYSSAVTALQREIDENNAQIEALHQEIEALSQRIESPDAATPIEDPDLAESELAAEPRRIRVSHYGLGDLTNNEGVVFPVEVEIVESGSGRILLDVRNVQFEDIFQASVTTAVLVASEHTGVTISDKDIIVTIVNETGRRILMEGASSGALIAVMVVAGLEEKQIDPSVFITGNISSAGTITRVGGLSAKADAAADFGAEILLVPNLQEFHASAIVVEGVIDLEEVVTHMVVE